MNTRLTRLARRSVVLIVSIGMALGTHTATGSEAQERLPVAEPPQATSLPPDIILPQTPRRLELKFTGPGEGFPPRPVEMRNVGVVPWQPIPGRLNEQLEARIRQAAISDPVVREQLGERYAYIDTTEVEPPKGRRPDDIAALATIVTFYSYTNNVAVEVHMQNDKVVKVESRPRYQPQAGVDEIEAAIKLARADERIRTAAQDLAGDAIVMSPPPEMPQAMGRRLLYVTFSKEEEDEPQYFAVVDLTTERVWAAGPSPEQ